MQPSSRTPEGDDNTCHVCGHEFRIDPSSPLGDAPCPHCGTLLWFAAGAVDAVDAMNVRQAASLWTRANAAIEANDLIAARQRLRRAIALDSSNTVFKETLSKVESRLMEKGPRKRGRYERRLPS